MLLTSPTATVFGFLRRTVELLAAETRSIEQAGGEQLEAAFGADGWKVQVDLQSILGVGHDREVDTSAVIEPEPEEALALIGRWVNEGRPVPLSASVGQLLEANRRAWLARNARLFGVRGPRGELAGTTALFSDGGVAQIEDVCVAPEARGGGHGRAMVSAATDAARQARQGLIFIVADDKDWPKELYAKLGFEPVSRTWSFHREFG